MAQPAQSFQLDRSIFNESLYSRMRDFWFAGIPEGSPIAPYHVVKRWWGQDVTQDERADFDRQCEGNFKHALETLTPDKLLLPKFASYEQDIVDAAAIATPFLTEVEEAQAQDQKKGADTLLSLILILDQMSRNIYRDSSGLRLVFTHFDRLAFTLFHASLRLVPNPMEHDAYRLRPVIKNWFLMPLMHAEHLPSHDLYHDIVLRWRKEVEAAGNEAAVENIDRSLEAEADHVKPLSRFGRYPHRNVALGRESTEDELEEMKTANTFGVQQEERGQKDEL